MRYACTVPKLIIIVKLDFTPGLFFFFFYGYVFFSGIPAAWDTINVQTCRGPRAYNITPRVQTAAGVILGEEQKKKKKIPQCDTVASFRSLDTWRESERDGDPLHVAASRPLTLKIDFSPPRPKRTARSGSTSSGNVRRATACSLSRGRHNARGGGAVFSSVFSPPHCRSHKRRCTARVESNFAFECSSRETKVLKPRFETGRWRVKKLTKFRYIV